MFRARRGGSSAAPAAETEGGRGRGEDASDEAGGGRGSAGSVPTLPTTRADAAGAAGAADAADAADGRGLAPAPQHPNTTLLPTPSLQYKHADTSIITIFSVLY